MPTRRFSHLLCALLACGAPLMSAPLPVHVTVDASRTVPGPLRLWGCANVSRRAAPPTELCALIEREFGQPQITRCWLMLDEMWDYRTNEYRYNYEVNKDYYTDDPNKPRYGVVGTPTGLRYYDYLDSVANHSGEVLLNVRRYEQELLRGMITDEQWREVLANGLRHYKQRCPNLRYIEVLNEGTAKNQSNIESNDNYYRFYRLAYQAVAQVNTELQPAKPLLVGGSSGFRTTEAKHLIREFAKDDAPDKRLDFVSFHHYWWQQRPAEVGEWEADVDQALAAAGLPTDLPIFVTELGYANQWQKNPARNLWQACGMTAAQFYARHSADLQLFPWVQYHSAAQIAFVQFDMDLRMMPYGSAVKMLRLHQPTEVFSASDGLHDDGNGLGVLATASDDELEVQVWNLQPDGETAAQVSAVITNLPAALRDGNLRVQRYLIDTTHSNPLTGPAGPGGLEMVEERAIDAADPLRLTAELEPMALCLWAISRG